MVKLGKQKKGSIQDLILIGAVLLFFSLVVLFSFKIGGEFNTEVQSRADFPDDAKEASAKLINYYPSVIDKLFVLLLISLAIGAWILAALVRIHPIFIPLFIIAWVFIIFLSGINSNIYEAVASNPELVNEASQLVVISSIMTYLPLIVGVVGIILMIVQYKQWSTGQ